MSTALDELHRRLASNEILNRSTFPKSESKLNLALDSRYKREFETEWMRVYHSLKDHSDRVLLPENEVTEIRRLAFVNVFKMIPHHELCGLVSDDFGLFAEAIVLNYKDPWLNALFKSYVGGSFPFKIKPVNETIEELLSIKRQGR